MSYVPRFCYPRALVFTPALQLVLPPVSGASVRDNPVPVPENVVVSTPFPTSSNQSLFPLGDQTMNSNCLSLDGFHSRGLTPSKMD